MNRRDYQEAIGADDQDLLRFVETLGEARAKDHWQVHAYSLQCVC